MWPNDPQAQARAAELHHPDATTGAQVTWRESIPGRMSPAAQWLGEPLPRIPRCSGVTTPTARRRS